MPVISPITACEISVIKQDRSEEVNMKSFCLCYFMWSGSQSLATLIPDFLSQEPISRSEQLSSALAMASILFLDGFSANFEYKISLTSPSVETGDRKVFSDVLT